MANEALKANNVDYSSVVQYNYGTGTALVKGSFLIADETKPFTATVHATNNDVIPLGILVEDRDSDDTQQDRVGVFRKGDFYVIADGTISYGQLLELGTTANRVAGVPNVTLSNRRLSRVIGISREAAVAGSAFLATIDIL